MKFMQLFTRIDNILTLGSILAGSRKGIGLIKLDRVNRGIYVRQHVSITIGIVASHIILST
jgi:hypothetical protein